MAGRGISTPAVAIAAAGAVTVYAAMKGIGLASGFRNLLAGQPLPPGQDLTVPLGQETGAGGAELGVNSPIAGAALGYVGAGHLYRYGGASPAGWDCSGFVNWVLCHDLGYAIPGYGGGQFTGASHGPVTGQWALWSGCQTIDRSQLDAGDLAIWPLFHMGIAISNGEMVSAPGPNGTPAPTRSGIDGAASGPLVCRRLLGRR